MNNNMDYNFNKLKERIWDTISKSDLEEIRDILANIKEATLVSGVGGSNVVSTYFAKVISKKNNIICESITPRDMIYRNLGGFKNIVCCSYSGNNYGVIVSFNNNLNKYLFSKNKRDGITNINYKVVDDEISFISLSSTLIPMTILLLYYTDNLSIIESILNIKLDEKKFQVSQNLQKSKVYEILSGYESSTAARFIETTMAEAGLFTPLVHDKYDYCHGRSTLNYEYNNNLIFFDNGTELDKHFQNILPSFYQNIISLKRKFADDIINDYYLTYISMLLCKKLAISLDKDLSCVKYSPLVKKLYKYKGGM